MNLAPSATAVAVLTALSLAIGGCTYVNPSSRGGEQASSAGAAGTAVQYTGARPESYDSQPRKPDGAATTVRTDTTGSDRLQPLAETPLGRLAADLAPGNFRVLETQPPVGDFNLSGLFHVETPEGRSVPIDAWTDSGHWDPERKQTLFQGLHRTNKFISYNAERNSWRELGWQGTPPPRHEEDGYTYGRTAVDSRRGHFYRLAGETLYRYDIEAEHWDEIGPTPIGGYTPLAWHRELDMLVNLRNHIFRGFDGERWHELGESSVSGEHSAARYNAVRNEVLAIGGEGSESAVSLLDELGDVRTGAEAPFAFQLSLDNLVYDPQSGLYLVLRWDERELWEYDAELDDWRLAREWSSSEWPFRKFGTVVPIPIDELGVIFWQYEHGPRIYRHRPSTEQRVAGTDRRGAESAPSESSETPATPRATSPRLPGSDVQPTVPERQPSQASTNPHKKLAAIGETMEPGEWRYVGEDADKDLTTYPEGMNRFRDLAHVRFCDGDGYSGGTMGNGWTNSWQYDPETQSFWLLAMRDRSEKKLIWLDADLNWGYASMPWGRDCSNNRRPFNRLTLVDGKLYWPRAWWGDKRVNNGKMHVAPIQPYLDGQTDVDWEMAQGPGWGETSSGQIGDFAVAWVPEIEGWMMQQPGGTRSWNNSERLELSQEGHTTEGEAEQKQWGGARLYYYRPGIDEEWTLFDVAYPQGYQGLLLHNPVKQQVLQLPGSFNPSRSYRREFGIIHPTGGRDGGPWLEKLDQIVGGAPDGYSASTSYVTYHPITGQWLWMEANAQTIWISDDGKHWDVYEDFSTIGESDLFPDGRDSFSASGGIFGASPSVQVNPVPGTDLLVFFDYYAGLILHRLKGPEDLEESSPSNSAQRQANAQPPTSGRTEQPFRGDRVDISDTWLGRTAGSMNTGEWHFPVDGQLPRNVGNFGAFWNYQTKNNNSNDFWAPVSVWNPVDGRTYSILDRTAGGNEVHSVVFSSYDALDHRFVHNPVPDRRVASSFGAPHVYGRWALDIGRQKMYRFRDGIWIYDIPTETWEHRLDFQASGMGGSTTPLATHEALGEVLGMDARGVIRAWNPDTGKTRVIARLPEHSGRHAHAQYNQVRQEWSIAFGEPARAMIFVDGDDHVTKTTMPSPIIGDGKSSTLFSFYDPITGHYLVKGNDRKIWEYDPEQDLWGMAFDLGGSDVSFPKYHGYLITPIPEANVILWLHRSSGSGNKHQRLYKHESIFQ